MHDMVRRRHRSRAGGAGFICSGSGKDVNENYKQKFTTTYVVHKPMKMEKRAEPSALGSFSLITT